MTQLVCRRWSPDVRGCYEALGRAAVAIKTRHILNRACSRRLQGASPRRQERHPSLARGESHTSLNQPSDFVKQSGWNNNFRLEERDMRTVGTILAPILMNFPRRHVTKQPLLWEERWTSALG